MTGSSSVIVVSYRPGSWLAPCLESVRDQTDQLIVVDNASAGHEAGDTGRRAGAAVVTCRSNLGFAGGVAAGLQQAEGDVIGVLNDDAVAGPGWMAESTRALEGPGTVAVTPKVRLAGRFAEVVVHDRTWFADGDARPLGRQLRSVRVDGVEELGRVIGPGVHRLEGPDGDQWRWTTGGAPFYVPVVGDGARVEVDGDVVTPTAVTPIINHVGSHLLDHGVAAEDASSLPDDGRADLRYEPFGFSGTAPVFRHQALRELGSFEERFFAYGEDTDWCLRARLAGYRIAYQPDAVVEHRLSATSGGPSSPLVRFLGLRNSFLCLMRNAPPEVAQRYLWRMAADNPPGGVRRSVLRHTPWALGSRRALRRTWTRSPREIWDRWARMAPSFYEGPAGTWAG